VNRRSWQLLHPWMPPWECECWEFLRPWRKNSRQSWW